MALLVDPDNIVSTEVVITTATRRIALNEVGGLSTDGITLQCLYSYLKEEWKTQATLIPYPFPMVAISPEKMEFVDGWELTDDADRKLIRNGGWREVDNVGSVKEEWTGVITLGNISAGHNAYYYFDSTAAKADFTYTEAVNEAIQSYGDASHGDFDYRTDILTVFVREQGMTYAQTTTVDVGIADGDNLDYKVIRFPLAEATDLNITATDNDIETTTPYTNMSILFATTPQSKSIPSAGDPHNFGVIVTCAGGTVKQIYEFLQHELRAATDIDSGTSGQLGVLTDQFSQFVGSRLDTLQVANDQGTGGDGTFLDNVATADTNNMRMIDNLGTYYEYPFVSTGRINFNTNLSGDANGIYRMYFTYTKGTTVADCAVTAASDASATLTGAATLPLLVADDYFYLSGAANAANNGIWVATGTPTTSALTADKFDGINPIDETTFAAVVGINPYGSPDALIVDDNSDADIAGTISAAEYIDYDFDYDGNVQGARVVTDDAEITVVAIGHGVAQFVAATGTIERKTGNSVSLVAALERNFSNPT